jgi:type II secretory pathway pseudopilin PulG
MKKYALTLAEVLITLGIIGIVAALVMPALINSARDKALVTALKKNYSILSQATTSIVMDNPVAGWNLADNNTAYSKEFFEYYRPYLNIIKDCGCGTYVNGCWSKDITKALTGVNYPYARANSAGVNSCNVTLADGTNMCFDFWDAKNAGVTSSRAVSIIVVDVNGNKKPNMMGRDVFRFILTAESNRLLPAGIDNGSANCVTTGSSNLAGSQCAAKVLYEGKISY